MYHFFYSTRDSFSNFHPSPFEYGGIKFTCVEQFFMYVKAKMFGDSVRAERIMKTNVPKTMKNNGRLVKDYDPVTWDKYKRQVMYIASREKVLQNPKIKQELLDTYPKTIVEASPWDIIWGIGLSMKDPLIHDEKNWRGQNLLGKILTELRDDLMNGTSYVSEEDEQFIINLLS